MLLVVVLPLIFFPIFISSSFSFFVVVAILPPSSSSSGQSVVTMAAAEEMDQNRWAFDFEIVDASGDVIFNGEPSLEEGDGGQNIINIDFLHEEEDEAKEERPEIRTLPPFFEEEVRTAASTNTEALCEEPGCRQKATFSFGRKQAPVRCKGHRFPEMK